VKGGGDMLTAKQEQFVKNIIDGMSQADAYRNAYPNQRMSDKTIHESASRLMNNSKIIARLKELREQLVAPTIMSAQERLEYLTRVIKGEQGEKAVQMVDGEPIEVDVPTSLKNKLNAIDIMNKMQGEYVTKVEGELKMRKLEDLL
jgi:phage terminase small subunit